MKQPVHKNNKNKVKKEKKKGVSIVTKKRRVHKQEYGTSKLEEDFASEFLDKLDVEYTYQFLAEDIGRYYDFFLPKQMLLIEVDGDYW